MSDQKKVDAPPEPTVITLVLPVDKTKPATVTVRNGALGHLSSFAYDDFKDICTALHAGMCAFVGVQANPPQNIQASKPKQAKASKKSVKKKAKKVAGKPPYKLVDAKGQSRTLNKMFDPFELQDQYHKSNPKFKFDDLDEAIKVAQVLLDAGLEKQVTITYSNGKAVKVLPEPKPDPVEESATQSDPSSDISDDTEATTEDVTVIADTDDNTSSVATDSATDTTASTDGLLSTNTDHDAQVATSSGDDPPAVDTSDNVHGVGHATDPESGEIVNAGTTVQIDTDAKQALVDVLQDDALAMAIYDDIQTHKKHGWKKNLIKQREVKGMIAMHVDGKETLIEAIYQIVCDSVEFEDEQQANPTARASAPLMTVMTSPDLAKAKGVPEYNEFSLATSDDDEDEISEPVATSAQTPLL